MSAYEKESEEYDFAELNDWRGVFVMPNSWAELSPYHDDRVAFEIAFSEAAKQHRVAVFGAIRRAVATMRMYELFWPDHAKAIRHAIRAAIGSEKK